MSEEYNPKTSHSTGSGGRMAVWAAILGGTVAALGGLVKYHNNRQDARDAHFASTINSNQYLLHRETLGAIDNQTHTLSNVFSRVVSPGSLLPVGSPYGPTSAPAVAVASSAVSGAATPDPAAIPTAPSTPAVPTSSTSSPPSTASASAPTPSATSFRFTNPPAEEVRIVTHFVNLFNSPSHKGGLATIVLDSRGHVRDKAVSPAGGGVIDSFSTLQYHAHACHGLLTLDTNVVVPRDYVLRVLATNNVSTADQDMLVRGVPLSDLNAYAVYYNIFAPRTNASSQQYHTRSFVAAPNTNSSNTALLSVTGNNNRIGKEQRGAKIQP